MTSMPNEAMITAMSEAARVQVEAGNPVDAVMDAMLTVTMGWVLQTEGPREVSRRLYLLAVQAAALADEVEQGQREGLHEGVVH